MYLAVAMLEPDLGQPRKTFDEQKLLELAESLKNHGQLQPVVVRRGSVMGRWQIVAGERRWRACKLAGIERIKAIEIEERETDGFVREAQLVENLQRADMTPLETAEAYRSLMARWGISQNELARRLSVGAATVSRALALLQSPPETQKRIADGESVRRATGGNCAPRKRKAATSDKRRALELELVSGSVRVKRGHTLEQLVEELRVVIADRAPRADAA
jgi:ParB family chromosome partitioning protein